MPCHKTILNCFALEHSAFKNKTFERVLRHGIRLNFSSDNPALRPNVDLLSSRPTLARTLAERVHAVYHLVVAHTCA